MIDFGTIVVTSVTFLATYCYLRSRRPNNFPPGPFAWPIIGNIALTYQNKKIYRDFHALAKKHGPVLGLQLGFYRAIVLSDAKVIKEAFVNHADIFSDRPTWLPAMKFITDGKGIINSSGQTWANAKKLALSSMREMGFGSSTLEEKILVEVENTIEELRKLDKTNSCIRQHFSHATANIICVILFGERFQTQDKELDELVSAFHTLFQGEFLSLFGLLPTPLFFAAMLLLINTARKGYLTVKRVEDIVTKKMKQQRDTMEEANPRGLVDLFYQSGEKDEKQLRTMVFDLFGAGFETTASTLMWSFYFMIKNPEVQEKCRKEIHDVVGTDRLPHWKDKESLPYVTATLMEIQRIANVGALALTHNASTDVSLYGYNIPKNTIVVASLYNVHLDPNHWPEPEEFQPQRFLTADGLVNKNMENYMPFGIGRRSCMGENLAKMEHYLFFAAVIQKFRLSSNDPDKLPRLCDANQGATLALPEYLMYIEEL